MHTDPLAICGSTKACSLVVFRLITISLSLLLPSSLAFAQQPSDLTLQLTASVPPMSMMSHPELGDTILEDTTAQPPDLDWLTEDYPPFNYRHNGRIEGVAMDILRAMYQQLDWPLDEQHVLLMPWPRAYKMAQEQRNACLFSITFTEHRAQLFQFIGPAMDDKLALIGHRNQAYNIHSLAELGSLKIGVVRDDIGHQFLQEQGVSDEHFVFLKTGYELVRMLKLERVDLIAYGDIIAKYQFARAGINYRDYQIVLPLNSSFLGYACNKAIPKSTIALMNQALTVVKQLHPELFSHH